MYVWERVDVDQFVEDVENLGKIVSLNCKQLLNTKSV